MTSQLTSVTIINGVKWKLFKSIKGKIFVIDSDGATVMALHPAIHIFAISDKGMKLCSTTDVESPGFEFGLDSFDWSKCVPSIKADTITDCIRNLSDTYFTS
jgi:hypothetical protein